MTIKHFLLPLSLLFFIAACTKISETDIGTGLIPPVDGVITKDTDITIYAKNSTNIDTARISLFEDHALGYVKDPLFGTTSAAVNIQLLPTLYPFTFEVPQDSLTLDSVVLALDVRGVWGDTTQNLSLHVKELNNEQPFTSDSTFIIYNNTSILNTVDDITYNGVASVNPETLNDSFKVYQDSGVNMLRIRLTDAFGNRLLHTFTSAPGPYDSVSVFKSALKGLQVSADNVGNSLLRIGLADVNTGAAEPNTKLALYYRYSLGTHDTSVVKYLTINTASSSSTSDIGSAHSNYIKRDLGAGQAGGYFPSQAGINDDYVFVQTNPGTFATITIDSAALKGLPNWIIHRAEIVMEQAPDAGSGIIDNITAPYLFMIVKDKNAFSFRDDTAKYVIPGFDSTNISTADALFSVSTVTYELANYSDFGGIPFRKNNTDGVSINYYNFNVSRYVQGILTKKNPQYTFTLYTPYKEYFRLGKNINTYAQVTATPVNSVGIGRVRLYGGGSDVTNTHRMKLHIVYSIPH